MPFPAYLPQADFTDFIRRAFQEDVRDGDHSTLAAVPERATRSARLLVKDEGVLAGVEAAKGIFHALDPGLELEILLQDGAQINHGDIGFRIRGNARAILTAERLVLNTVQRMSGIATMTRKVVEAVKGTGVEILDTRKTTPNFRAFEKWAVEIGGGKNHRFGLFDLIMLKDNHVDFAGSITEAVKSTVAYLQKTGKTLRIEVETRNLKEVEEALRTEKVDIIMLDNMTPETMRAAVARIDGQCQTEASGGITLETVREVAECGVDFISLGALTHSALPLDLSLKAL